jgi:hypothetical protein
MIEQLWADTFSTAGGFQIFAIPTHNDIFFSAHADAIHVVLVEFRPNQATTADEITALPCIALAVIDAPYPPICALCKIENKLPTGTDP